MNYSNNKNSDNYINEDLNKVLNADLEENNNITSNIKSKKSNYQNKTLMSENEVCKSCNDLLSEKLWVTRGWNSPKKYCLNCSQKYTKNCITFSIIFGIIIFLISLTPLWIVLAH